MRTGSHTVLIGLAATALASFTAVPAAASVLSYHVTVDTSLLNGSSGYVDFQFNPFGSAQSATVTISSFNPVAALTGAPIFNNPGSPGSTTNLPGGASGNLAGAAVINNSGTFNDYLQGITFSNSFTFVFTYSGAAVTTPDGTSQSTFALSLFDSSVNPLLSTDPSGAVLLSQLGPNGSIVNQTFTRDQNGDPSIIALTAAPEPAAGLLLGAALLGLGWRARRNPARTA